VNADSVQTSQDQRLKPLTVAIAIVAVALAGIMPAVFARLPEEAKPWNLSIIGAIALFAASRLGFWWGVGFVGLAIGCKDTSMYLTYGWHPEPLSWLYFIGYAAIGWGSLRHSPSSLRIGAAALSSSLLFFLVSNFVCWLPPQTRYANSFQGLIDCYIAGIPFFRGTILGDLVFTGTLFGAYAVLSRVYSPKKEKEVAATQTEESW
jgi:hypothetical protein